MLLFNSEDQSPLKPSLLQIGNPSERDAALAGATPGAQGSDEGEQDNCSSLQGPRS